ncbi:hypothetical protein BDP55DRAFT_211045 [Colletotrichum godetiae]|uniref:Uncharacterized protein n=1 Tax=Colletotrichum godetiae TaxID=1209918 RepID=A0AAJ0AX35_9PEZI|nr:uncharacterized protein BDP55DRAFT_211045 [Colletotrichum godetiae]KAK1699910.1 hypothetical protein BDP55DRAFT_211045 [Colletotrichum godetiae]
MDSNARRRGALKMESQDHTMGAQRLEMPCLSSVCSPPSPFISTWISREGVLQFLLPFLLSIRMRGGFRHSAATRVLGRLISNGWFLLAVVCSLGVNPDVHDATETDTFIIEQARDLVRIERSQAGISVRGSGEEKFTATFDIASLDSANTQVIYTDICKSHDAVNFARKPLHTHESKSFPVPFTHRASNQFVLSTTNPVHHTNLWISARSRFDEARQPTIDVQMSKCPGAPSILVFSSRLNTMHD